MSRSAQTRSGQSRSGQSRSGRSRSGQSRSGRSRVVRGAAAVALAVLALGGCGGGASGSSADGGAASSGGRVAGEDAAAPQPAAGSVDGGAKGSDEPVTAGAADPGPLDGRRQVVLGELEVRVEDVPRAAAAVRSLADTAKGFVADEKTSTGVTPDPLAEAPAPGGSTSVLTVRVPQPGMARLMTQVAGLGDLVSRGQSSSDVTSTYVDVTSRVRTQRESVDRVRALLAKATTIGQVVQVEGELAKREADLESLQARLKALDDQTTLATVTVSLSERTTAAPAPAPTNAFVTGLRGGWDALGASVAVALKVVGAVLPFAVLLAVVAVPLQLLRRRRPAPAAPVS